jgi:hypothetical protein
MKRLAILACLIAAAPAIAQTPSPMEQALGAKIMAEMSTALQCSADAITLRAQLAAAQKELADLKANAFNSGSR